MISSTLSLNTIVNASLLSIIVILLIVLLIVVSAQQRKTKRRFFEMQNELEESVEELGIKQERFEARQHDDLIKNLHQLNENLLNVYGQMNRAQTEQINAVIRQSYDNAQAFDQRQQAMQRIVDENMQRNEIRMDAFKKSMDDNLRLLREENNKKLAEMRMTVDEKLNDTLDKRLNNSFSQVSERLEQVYRSLGEVHSLASGVGDLKKMLGNVKTRGIWGEMQLSCLLEQALTENQYDTNVAVVPGAAERVEFAIRLPGKEAHSKPIYLPIDSKFPQEDYVRLAEASQIGDQTTVENAQKALLNAVKTEAKRIRKYICPPFTTDFAVMFVPLEGLYAEIVKHSELLEVLQRDFRVLVSGPSTLLALLNSLQMGFRTLAIEQRSAEVWKLLGAVKADFANFSTVLHKTQEKLQQASESIDSAFVKTRNIEKRLRNVEALEAEEANQILKDE